MRGRIKLKKICTIGHYALGHQYLDGQTVKTKILTKEMIKHYGKSEVGIIDTYGGKKQLLNVLGYCKKALSQAQNVIIFPAENGLRVFAPLLVALNKKYHRKLYYVVIGGWLPTFILNKNFLTNVLRKFDGIFVETNAMKNALQKQGLINVNVIPNCKELDILDEKNLIYNDDGMVAFCTFSRVMKEKGIADAVDAIININKKYGKPVCSLDIYGQIDKNQEEWFTQLQQTFPKEVQYKGVVPFDQSTRVLKDYYALLFPTHYDGEGFAGTLIDAMAAGVPVVATDWKYNSEIIKEGKNGTIIKTGEKLEDVLCRILEDRDQWNSLKKTSVEAAKQYLPNVAMLPLFECIQ